MTHFFTSDLHLGHANIIAYCNRPFDDVGAMNAELIERWNAVVADDDTVHILGDLYFGRRAEMVPLVATLAGTKLLYPGNHDRWAKPGRREPEGAIAEILFGTQRLALGASRVLASHYPYAGDSGDHDRFAERRPVDRGEWLLHGHVHERWRQSGRQINVGVDAWGGFPVAEETLAELVAAGARDLRPLPWL